MSTINTFNTKEVLSPNTAQDVSAVGASVLKTEASGSQGLLTGDSFPTVGLASPKPLTPSQQHTAKAKIAELQNTFAEVFENKTPVINAQTVVKNFQDIFTGSDFIQLILSKLRKENIDSANAQSDINSKLRESNFDKNMQKLEDAQNAREKSEKLGGVFKWLSVIATAITIAVALLTLPSPMAILMLAGAVAGIVEMATADEKGGGILTKGIAKILETVLPKDIAEKVAPFVLAVTLLVATMGRSVVSTAGKAMTLAKNAVMPLVKNIAQTLPKITELVAKAGNMAKTVNEGLKAVAQGTTAFTKASTVFSKLGGQADDLIRGASNVFANAVQKTTGASMNTLKTAKDMSEAGMKYTLAGTQVAQTGVQAGAAGHSVSATYSLAETEELRALRQALDLFQEQLQEFIAQILKTGETLYSMLSEVLNSQFNSMNNVVTAYNKG